MKAELIRTLEWTVVWVFLACASVGALGASVVGAAYLAHLGWSLA